MIRIIKRIESLNDISFIIVIALVALFLKVPGILIGDLLVKSIGLTNPQFISDQQIPLISAVDFVTAVIAAPPIETFLGQFLPILIVSRFTSRNSVKIFFSSLVFSLSHLPVLGFLIGAFLIGIIFSWGYIIKSKQSRKKAFLLITLIHSLHNLLAFLLVLISKP